jgi:hypothetical protein
MIALRKYEVRRDSVQASPSAQHACILFSISDADVHCIK